MKIDLLIANIISHKTIVAGENKAVRRDDFELLRVIQRKSEELKHGMHILSDKIEENDLELQLRCQEVKIAGLHDKALLKLLSEKETPSFETVTQRIRNDRRIKRNTIFNISDSHIAEIAIRENQCAVTEVWKARKKYENASKYTTEIASEFIDLQEEFIARLHHYL